MRSTYVVASTPRSGSSLLGEGLQASGVAGRPAEYFAPDFLSVWRRWWGLPDDCPWDRYVRTALAYGTTPNGVRGIKIHWSHVLLLEQSLAVADGSVLDALFPGAVFVNTVRRDLRAQAVSLFRALRTDEWCRFTGSAPPAVDARTVRPDLATIRRLEAGIRSQQDAWTDYFRRRCPATLTVEYEELDADYVGQLARVLEFLGADPAIADRLPPTRLQRQSDALNRRWFRELDAAEHPGRT